MAQTASRKTTVARAVVALGAVFALLHLATTNDLLSNITRPVIVGLLKLLGLSARDSAGELVLGRMHVPWSRDCAGVNILAMLWAITLWANRAEPFSRLYWIRIVMAVPAAVCANILRILTLLAYRYAFFPAVESPQLHYFIGFLWVMPCLPFFVPRAGREPFRYVLETLFLVSALSLVSPFVPAPGGNLVTIAALLLVARSRYSPVPANRKLGAGLWVLAAGFIALASMESLWLPWLLLCPWCVGPDVYRSPARVVLVLGTIPLVSMHSIGRWVVAAAAIWEIGMLVKEGMVSSEEIRPGASTASWLRFPARAGIAFLLVFPFMVSAITGRWRPGLRPPAGAMSRFVAANTYELRLVGQPVGLQLMWYGPSGDGRHHTLPVCMRYRGIELKPSGVEPSVMTDGKMWMREFFLQRGRLLTDYRAYLQNTILPWSPAGVHIIASAPADSLSAHAFANSSLELAAQLSQLDAAALTQTPSRSLRQIK